MRTISHRGAHADGFAHGTRMTHIASCAFVACGVSDPVIRAT
jgi:hypothetical protein